MMTTTLAKHWKWALIVTRIVHYSVALVSSTGGATFSGILHSAIKLKRFRDTRKVGRRRDAASDAQSLAAQLQRRSVEESRMDGGETLMPLFAGR